MPIISYQVMLMHQLDTARSHSTIVFSNIISEMAKAQNIRKMCFVGLQSETHTLPKKISLKLVRSIIFAADIFQEVGHQVPLTELADLSRDPWNTKLYHFGSIVQQIVT